MSNTDRAEQASRILCEVLVLVVVVQTVVHEDEETISTATTIRESPEDVYLLYVGLSKRLSPSTPPSSLAVIPHILNPS
jgi:hypothetical protein